MKKVLSFSAFAFTTFLGLSTFAGNIHCAFEHGESLTYNEGTKRLTIVDPHSSHPKVETLIFSHIDLKAEGKPNKADGKWDHLQLVDKKKKVLLTVSREATEDVETGKTEEFKGQWDVGFGSLSGACQVSK